MATTRDEYVECVGKLDTKRLAHPQCRVAEVSSLSFFFNSPLGRQIILESILNRFSRIFRISRNLDVDNQSDVPLAISRGTLLWQPIFGQQNWPTSPLFIALVFYNGLEDPNADGRVNSGDDPTVYKIWWASTQEFTKLACTQRSSSAGVCFLTIRQRARTAWPAGYTLGIVTHFQVVRVMTSAVTRSC